MRAPCFCEAVRCNAEVDGGLGGPGYVCADGAGRDEGAGLEELLVVLGKYARGDGGCTGEPFGDVLGNVPGGGVAVDGEDYGMVLDCMSID